MASSPATEEALIPDACLMDLSLSVNGLLNKVSFHGQTRFHVHDHALDDGREGTQKCVDITRTQAADALTECGVSAQRGDGVVGRCQKSEAFNGSSSSHELSRERTL